MREKRTMSESAIFPTQRKRHSEPRLPEFEIALMTGMHQGEQFGLTWDRVDLDNATLRLNKTKNGKPRFVTLNTRALTVMKALREFNLEGDGSAQRVFILGQEPYWFPGAVTEAKIVDFHWHDLRHTFASRLVMAGVDIRTVQELLGHESITMTMRYAHLSPQHRATALEKLCQPTATTTATSEKTESQAVAPTIQ